MNIREFLTPKYFFLLVGVTLLIIFSRQVATTLLPFIVGIILATILEPIITFLERRARLPRPLAAMATLGAAVMIAWYALFVVVAKMISELIDLTMLLPQYRETITEMMYDLLGHFEQLNEMLPPIMSLNIQNSVDQFLKALEVGTRDLINRVLATFAGLPVFMVITLIVIVSAYFISRDKRLIFDSIMKVVPPHWHARVDSTKERMALDLIGFIKGRIFLLLVASLIAGAGLFLLNTRYWLIIALVIGILDNIPVVGPGVVFTPWIAMSVILGDTDKALFLTILYLLIFAVRQLIEPKVMGDSVGIHPLAMLLALYGGVVFFGVIGIFVGPFLAIVIKAIAHAGLFRPSLPE